MCSVIRWTSSDACVRRSLSRIFLMFADGAKGSTCFSLSMCSSLLWSALASLASCLWAGLCLTGALGGALNLCCFALQQLPWPTRPLSCRPPLPYAPQSILLSGWGCCSFSWCCWFSWWTCRRGGVLIPVLCWWCIRLPPGCLSALSDALLTPLSPCFR